MEKAKAFLRQTRIGHQGNLTMANISTGEVYQPCTSNRKARMIAMKVANRGQILAIPRCGEARTYTFILALVEPSNLQTFREELLVQMDQITSF